MPVPVKRYRRRRLPPKKDQIRGIHKALENPKTPRQFIPSLKKRLKQLEE